MKQIHYSFTLLAFLIETNCSLLDLNELKNNILKWKEYLNVNEVGALSSGLLDINDIKNKIVEWKTQKLNSFKCPSNAPQIQTLLAVVCTTAQPTNTTLRDACLACFSRVTSIPEGPQELTGLSACANQYFDDTSYEICATQLQTLSTSALNVQTSGCYMGYCDFIRCLRSVNAMNLIVQCTREARTGINIMQDADNVRYYTNVTSCILSKSRCSTFNPITGAPQIPGSSASGNRITNALQISNAGDLRIIAFSSNTKAAASFCTRPTNLTQTNWLTNVC